MTQVDPNEMTDLTIAQYATGDVRKRIETALGAAGKEINNVTTADLAMLEDFHSLGRIATVSLIELAQIDARDRVLDAGSGVGGTARLIAAERGCRVSAVDVTPEYCETAKWLNERVGLGDRIEVQVADVTALPFDAASFDVVVSQHVQMNVADKHRLYSEARRVLAPGGRLALWDVTAGSRVPQHLPVPWASSPEQSHLVTPERLAALLEQAGFAVSYWQDLSQSAGDVMRDFFAGDQAPLGLHVFVPDFQTKVMNLIRNIDEDRVRLIQAVLSVPTRLPSRRQRTSEHGHKLELIG
jgi:ubiquinone/menaquinone biosynthesis C-methylase UbiE